MYNILAKVLTNRLRKVLGKVIDNRQIAFGGRQLLHSVLVENEVVVMQKRGRKVVYYIRLILKRVMIWCCGNSFSICYID